MYAIYYIPDFLLPSLPPQKSKIGLRTETNNGLAIGDSPILTARHTRPTILIGTSKYHRGDILLGLFPSPSPLPGGSRGILRPYPGLNNLPTRTRTRGVGGERAALTKANAANSHRSISISTFGTALLFWELESSSELVGHAFPVRITDSCQIPHRIPSLRMLLWARSSRWPRGPAGAGAHCASGRPARKQAASQQAAASSGLATREPPTRFSGTRLRSDGQRDGSSGAQQSMSLGCSAVGESRLLSSR